MSHSGKYNMKYFNFDFGFFDTVKTLKNGYIRIISKSRIFEMFQK